MFKVNEKYRVRTGHFASDASYGNNGAFMINRGRTQLHIVVADGMGVYGWEHVSVHCVTEGKMRTPTWAEMCFVKDQFWGEEDCVVQYHPPKSDYVNVHPHVLHLWRPLNETLPRPNKQMV